MSSVGLRKIFENQRHQHVEGHYEDSEDNNVVDFLLERIVVVKEKAALLRIHGENMWIPLSHLVYADKATQTVAMSEWIAYKKGLM